MLRLPFTLSMLACMVGLAIWSNTHQAALDPAWLNVVGFAPWHLSSGEWLRLLVSALFTSGGFTLYISLLMFAGCVGTLEWQRGTGKTCLTFWCVHLATLLLGALLVAYPLHALRIPPGTFLVQARDVGPSAGYYGCLGALLMSLPTRWRYRLLGGLLVVLACRLGWSLREVDDQRSVLTADLAHLIALPLGALLFRERPERGD
ncbi:MAG TPA: hypothetical protein VL096_09435 [Pirellulaceae bacterium]|nr:hypothetical protein [Pirellulaceae bacterium]